MLLPVTLALGAACGVLNLWLAMRVARGRIAGQTTHGAEANDALIVKGRAHSNFTEYAPFVLVLVAAIELAGGSHTWLWVAAVAFVLARILHPLGMDRPAPNPLRAGGIMGTWLILAVLAGWAATLAYQARAAAPIATYPVEMPRG